MAYSVMPNPYGGPPNVRFESPLDFVEYVDSLGETADPGSRRQADEIRRNPRGWTMSGGHPRKKDDFLARNLPWIGPAAIGGAIAGPAIAGMFGGGGGGGAAAGAGAGASMNQAIPPAISALGGVGGGTGMIAPAAAMNGAAGAGGRSLLNRVLTGVKDYAPLGLAGLSAARGLTQGQTDAEKRLDEILGVAKGRVDASEPLFQALMAMARDQMPDAYKR